MNPEAQEREPREPREIRIEGSALLITAAAVLALLAGVFYLGVRVGRQATPAIESQAAPDHAVAESPPSVASANHFDAVPDPKTAEPERQVKSAAGGASVRPASPAAPAPTPGSFFVQVFAGRDRRTAESLLKTLGEKGYPVRLDTQQDGQDALYKVRVGGYPTQDEARQVAERLKGEGQSGAWVTQVR